MKILIIYNSKYGSSRKYAFILGKKLNGDILNFKNISKYTLEKYEMIIFSSGIYEEKIRGLNKFFTFEEILERKKVIICAVGIEKRSLKKYEELKENNKINGNKKELFYLMGSYTFKKLKVIDKIKMFLFLISMIFKLSKSSEEKSFLENGFGHINYYDEEGLIKVLIKVDKIIKTREKIEYMTFN